MRGSVVGFVPVNNCGVDVDLVEAREGNGGEGSLEFALGLDCVVHCDGRRC